jgi:GTP-binding protein
MELLDRSAVSFQAVLTKADKPKKMALERTIQAVVADLRKHPAAYPELLVTSSEDLSGVPTMRAAIAAIS